MQTRMILHLLALSTTLFLSACQEKIAPELSDPGGSGSGTVAPPPAPLIRTFSVSLDTTPTGVTPEDLGYNIHKTWDTPIAPDTTGIGKCETEVGIEAPQDLLSPQNITCFVEAEEFALFFNGINFKATSSPGACDYIVSEPFSYWRFQPGASLRVDGTPRQVAFFDCDPQALEETGTSPMPGGFGSFAGPPTTVNDMCGKYYNVDAGGGSTFGSLDLSHEDGVDAATPDALCSFNYNANAKCDEGSIIVHRIRVTAIDTDPDPDIDNFVPVVSSAGTSQTNCGGNASFCLGGAIRDVINDGGLAAGIRGLIDPISVSGGTVNMSIQRSYLRFTSNLHSANYIRQCSGTPNYNDPASFNPSVYAPPALQARKLNGDLLDKTLQVGDVDDYISRGVSTSEDTTQQVDFNQMDIIRLADDPFRAGFPLDTDMGDATFNRWLVDNMKAQPFYKFTCLDKAFEPKARIRIAVREWNRSFNAQVPGIFSENSDIYKRTQINFNNNSLMDSGSPILDDEYLFLLIGQPFDPIIYPEFATYRTFNNLLDWDDRLKFNGNSCGLPSYGPPPLSGMDTNLFPVQNGIWFPGNGQ